MGGAHAVAEASDPLTLACGSMRTDAFGMGPARLAFVYIVRESGETLPNVRDAVMGSRIID